MHYRYLIAVSINKLGNHPELIARQDALLLGIYRRLGKMTGETDDFTDLTNDWLGEVAVSHEEEIEAWEQMQQQGAEEDAYANIRALDS